MTRSHVLLGASHLAGNALLLWLGYYWLGMPESDASHLALSALVALIFALGALWLHGAAFAFFSRSAPSNFHEAGATSFRRLLPLLVLAAAVAIVYGVLARWHASFQHPAFVIGSAATMTLRKPVSPNRVLAGFHALIWLLRWIVVPVLAFPLASRIVVEGWSAFRWRSFVLSRRWLYWFEVCALLLCAIWLPLWLLRWIPKTTAFDVQMTSFAARIGVGYLLFVAALLALEFFTSSGKPRSSQPITTFSP
jgi:hypothetical protein